MKTSMLLMAALDKKIASEIIEVNEKRIQPFINRNFKN
jgi:hypothetical protein